jgi:1,4-dihydroxy-2-naphthoate octaprenyltransferase
MAQLKDWIHAARLRTLPLSVAGIITGSAAAFALGKWNGTVFALALCTTLLFQILSNLANDLGDTLKGADNANRVGPTRAVQSGAISPKTMRNAVILVSLLSFIAALLLIYVGSQLLSKTALIGYVLLAIACITAAILYTVGKKAYGYNGMGDLFVFLFFGLVSVIGVYPLFGNELSWIIILPAITIGNYSTAVLNLNNMRDQENDALVGKNTVVVKWGNENAKKYHALLFIIGFLSWVSFLILTNNTIGFISLLPFILFLKHLKFVRSNTIPKSLDGELKKVALGTFFTSVLYFITVIIQQYFA